MDDQAGSELERRLEAHRRELAAHCRRILGSTFEADDAVQETLVRAWRKYDRLENPSALRVWLYRIATNVCLDMLDGPQRRAHPMDPASWQAAGASRGDAAPRVPCVRPILAGRALPACDDPAEHAISRDAIRRAFVVALLHLPPRQRCVLILCDVLRWRAAEVAELLGATVASVNSARQRARSNLADRDAPADQLHRLDDAQRALLQRHVDAFARHDVGSLVSLLRPPGRPPTDRGSGRGVGELPDAGARDGCLRSAPWTTVTPPRTTLC